MLKFGRGVGCVWTSPLPLLAQRRFLPQLSEAKEGEVEVRYVGGFPELRVPLPSRRERGVFTLRPVSHTVADFLRHLRAEDAGVSQAAVYDEDGDRLAGDTLIEDLMRRRSFRLRINDEHYAGTFPPTLTDPILREKSVDLTDEALEDIGEVRTMVAKLHTVLHIREHQVSTEKKLLARIEELREELEPYEEHQRRIRELGERMSKVGQWGFLVAMGLQWGAFARLTWWEYSWDIMEPVTYFATYSTVIAGYVYWVLTKSPVEYGEMMDRIALKTIHRNAKRQKFDLERYNKLKDELANQEYELHRLRDPHRLKLPPAHLRSRIIYDD